MNVQRTSQDVHNIARTPLVDLIVPVTVDIFLEKIHYLALVS